MKPINSCFFLILSILFLTSCWDNSYNGKSDIKKMREIVKNQNALLEEAFKTGNAEKLAALYTDSAKLSPDGNDFVIGREKIKTFWENDFKTSKLLDMKTEVLTTNGTQNFIYETGKTTTKSLYQDSIYTFKVKYVNVWIKQPDGNYQLEVDFWNRDK